MISRETEEKLYFVVETKSSLFSEMLRPAEQAKIDCGIKHFAVLGEGVNFTKADNFENFMNRIEGLEA